MAVDRNPSELRNGRSRGPSPNGHAAGTPDSSDDDSTKKSSNNKNAKTKSEYEEKIRVGKDYQTTCPELIAPNDRKLETLNDRALLVWSPTKDIPDGKLEEFITVAKEKYGYNGEQALGMLFWHKHDLERAVLDLANFTPFPDEWTDEDKVLFEQAFQFHGKSFVRIRQMLPDKSIASLVKYYYSWKKTRSRTSVMDQQEKQKMKEGSENGSENGSNEESDSEDKTNNASATTNGSMKDDPKPNAGCYGCGVACNHTNMSPHGALCNSCFHHWSRTGTLRPTTGPGFGKRSRGNSFDRQKRKPPRGMYINHDDIVALASPENVQTVNRNDDLLASMDREIISLMSQIQCNKQLVSSLKRKSSDDVDDLWLADNANRLNSRWNSDELQLAVKGIQMHGKKFQAIAEMLGTKTEAQVRTFFVNYRRKYNLDALVKEHEEKDQEQQQQTKQIGKQDGDQPKLPLTPSAAATPPNSNDISRKNHDDDIMEIDLVDDIPNNKEDDDIEEVAIIEKEPTKLSANTKMLDSSQTSITVTAQTSSPILLTSSQSSISSLSSVGEQKAA